MIVQNHIEFPDDMSEQAVDIIKVNLVLYLDDES